MFPRKHDDDGNEKDDDSTGQSSPFHKLNVIMITIVIWNNCISCLNQDIVIDISMLIRGESD